MRVISTMTLKDFWLRHKEAEKPLKAWYRIVSENAFENLVDLRCTFPTADLFHRCVVFNIGGNKFRLITAIHFNRRIVFVRNVLTHKEYDKGNWKNDCL